MTAQDSPGADPGERGTLVIHERVVQRVAAHAVTGVEHAAAAPRRVLGVSVGQARRDAEPSVTASVYGGTATVQASIAVAWPRPVPEVADQVRRRVRQEVERTTGVHVDQIDVQVTSLDIPARTVPRVR